MAWSFRAGDHCNHPCRARPRQRPIEQRRTAGASASYEEYGIRAEETVIRVVAGSLEERRCLSLNERLVTLAKISIINVGVSCRTPAIFGPSKDFSFNTGINWQPGEVPFDLMD